MKRSLPLFLLLISCCIGKCFAQDTITAPENVNTELEYTKTKKQPISITFDVRADWEYHVSGIKDKKDESAFAGKFLNFTLHGNINKYFSYHFRYRFNKVNTASDFFNATDYAYLNYDINKNWRVSAGKQVIAIGGFEYDKAPIDVYFYSGYANNISTCYEFGVSGQYMTNDGRNTIMLQITNSPFTDKENRFNPSGALYSYNLAWYGNYGVFNSIYSVNMVEYADGKYINYIALGNQFNFGPISWYIDWMNRYGGKGNFFADFSIMSRLNCNIAKDRLNLFVKGGIDYNNAQNASTNPENILDLTIKPGTKYGYYGAGAEFYPIKNSKELRLHAWWTSNTDNVKAHTVGVGVKWILTAFERK